MTAQFNSPILRRAISVTFAVMIAAAQMACDSSDNSSPTGVEDENDFDDVLVVDENGTTSIDAEELAEALQGAPEVQLSEAEIAGLLFMREEEKLALDVYLTLHAQWGLNIFENIALAEQTHTDAVRALIKRFDLNDPSAGVEQGDFQNDILQALHDELVTAGNESLIAALRVGAAIEEIDILDLEELLEQTEQPDIIAVYDNLLKGSRNHLRSFVSTISTQSGEVYEPQYLTAEAYEAIVSTPTERGGQG